MQCRTALAGALAALALSHPTQGFATVRDPLFAAGQPCDVTRTLAVQRLEDIVTSVRSGDGRIVSAALDRNWALEAGDSRAGVEPVLLRWARANRDLQPIQVCAVAEKRRFGVLSQ